MEIGFDDWYTVSTHEIRVQAILERHGLLNIMASRDASSLSKDPSDIEVIESIGLLRCSNWDGSLFSEGILDTLKRAAERGGEILRNILRRILKPVINKLPAAFASIASAWTKIKPYAEKLNEMLSAGQKKTLRSMLRMVNKRPRLSVECREASFPLLEAVMDEARSVKVIGALARMQEKQRKDTRIEAVAKNILSNNNAMMAIAGIGGVLFGASFGGTAVGAVGILILIVIAYYVFKWLAAYSKNDPALKKSLERVNTTELKRVSEEAKDIIERETEESGGDTIEIKAPGFITLQGGEPVFGDDKSLNIKNTGNTFEYHGQNRVIKIEDDGINAFKEIMGDKYEEGHVIELRVELRGKNVLVPLGDDFNDRFTKLLKGLGEPVDAKSENEFLTAIKGATEALRGKDLGNYRAQMIIANDYATDKGSKSIQIALEMAKKIADSPTADMTSLGITKEDLARPHFSRAADEMKLPEDVREAAKAIDQEHAKLLYRRLTAEGRAEEEAYEKIEKWLS